MDTLKPAFISLFFLLISFITAAQSDYTYNPLKDDVTQLTAARKMVSQQYYNDSISVKGENKKYILDIFRDRFKSIDELFTENQLITSTEVNTYLRNITNEIISKNSQLKKLTPRFFFSRAYWPNAYSTGEGTIVFNIDLFAKLKNESQVAFVICHELAHLFLEHSNKKIDKYINTVYSDEFQKKLKQLKKQEYDKKSELDKLEQTITFKSLRHSREFESEADSVGLAYLKNTNYDCREVLTCLALLDEVDEEHIDIDSKLPGLFSFNEYPFKKRWLKKEDAFFGGVDTKEKKPLDDSLKTHPDCQVRIKLLTPEVEKIQSLNRQIFIQGEDQFARLQTLFQFEIINSCFAAKKISRCLFNSIKLMERYPSNPYLVTVTGDCFSEMYKMQKDHRLYTVADLPSPYREKKYNRLLEFLNQLSLTDMSSLGYYFLKQHADKLSGNTAFVKVLQKSEQDFKSTTANK